LEHAAASPLCQPVHGRRSGDLQGRLVPEFPDGLIGHAIPENDNILHLFKILRCCGSFCETDVISMRLIFAAIVRFSGRKK
jgi:hypothetical protein